MAELDKHYDPKAIEDKWYNKWVEDKRFSADPEGDGEVYSIVIPPPNVTGILHMGHALNNTIQDVLIRWKRMQGVRSLWVPGTDHAGIATQNVVERKLKKEGLTRDDLGREKFIEQVWDWKDQYGSTITNQLKKLGSSCDWEHERFTMDEGLSKAVREVFVRLYDKDLIYRGNRIINWCPRCETALSDEESEHADQDGKLYYIRYPLADGSKKEGVVVATTRPETLLGDAAVAINPRDKRYEHLKDKKILLPILNRELAVIEDDYVDPEFGTGVVKITPAHDPNDYEMGQRHNLEQINVMHDNGTMNELAGPYDGMDRFACRKQLLKDLDEQGLLEKVEDHKNSVGHCYRCDTVVEPRLSPQWFVKMGPLAGPAVDAVKDGRIKFIPERWNKVYMEWMDNIRDWCISRQIWWGHRIPVFYCNDCGKQWAALEDPESCECSSTNIRQDEDVLDTWFSSWLWPFSVFGWPEKTPDLAAFYPTQSLTTASEIIFFWVARMVMAGCEFMGEIPFSEVYIHGTVRDDDGKKMSKSLGNSIDPLDIIEKYSADALRFSLMMLTATGQDVYISDEKFELGRNFGTKIWNAARFMQMQVPDVPEDFANPDLDLSILSADDLHIIAKLHKAIDGCNDNLERFRFNDVAKEVYDFLWHHFCDWYIESSKQVFFGDDEARKAEVAKVIHHVFSSALRLLHPLMPFVTEELWHGMGYATLSDSIMNAPWPKYMDEDELADWGISPELVEFVDAKHDLIRVGRTLMGDYKLTAKHNVSFICKPADEATAKKVSDDTASILKLMRGGELIVDTNFEPDEAMPSGLSRLGALYMPLKGLVDVEAEMAKLTKQLDKIDSDLKRLSGKLNNEDFVAKAPEAVVEMERARKVRLLEEREKLENLAKALRA